MLKDMYVNAIQLINEMTIKAEDFDSYADSFAGNIQKILNADFTYLIRISEDKELYFKSTSNEIYKRNKSALLKIFSILRKKTMITLIKTSEMTKDSEFSDCLFIPFIYSQSEKAYVLNFKYTDEFTGCEESKTILDTIISTTLVNFKNKYLTKKQKEIVKIKRENEREVKHHQMYFKQLFDNMSNGVAIFTPIEDKDGENFIFKDYNKAGEKLDGKTREEVIGKKVTDVFPGVKNFGLFDILKEVNKTGKSKRLPVSLYNSETLVAWRENEVVKLPDGSIVSIYNDLTIQKLAEAKAERYSKYARALIENSPHPMMLINSEKKIEYVNPSFESITEYTLAECIGMDPHFPWEPEEDFKTLSELYSANFSGKRVHTEIRLLNKSGIPFWVEMHNVPIQFSKDKVYYISYWVDITERKYTEVILKKSEEEKKKILDALVSGLYIYDYGKQTDEYINPAYTKMLGWTLDDINSMGEKFFELFTPDDRKRLFAHLSEIKLSKTDFSRVFEYRFKTKDNRIKWLLSYDIPFERDINGNVTKMLGSFVDVTDRVKVERALVESEKKAKEANRAKSEFIANMSHEIRTPLNGVIGFTDLMMTTELDEDQQQYVRNIQSSSIVLMDLINDILDFSKIESGKLELEDEEFDLAEMFERAMEMIRLKAQDKGIELLLDFPPNIPRFVYGDSVRLRQIIVNFLSNSVKFTEKGDIELSIEIMGKNEKDRNVRLRFVVSDTGIGIAGDKLHNILEEFTQADNTITRKYGGTGLGLAISKKLLEKMGSELIIESHVGRGSKFSFELNMHYSDSNTYDYDNFQISTVLIVDDNIKNLEILEKIFKHWGISVEKAINGFEALQKMAQFKDFIDLVIIDYSMPYMSGVETIKKMRTELKITNEQMPMIILYSSTDIKKIEEDDADDYIDKKIMKPVTINELYNVLSDCPRRPAKHENENWDINRQGTVMIVEDNGLNRELLKKYLSKLGSFKILEADNGRLAINLYAKNKNRVDLIFMDIQMPEMDGYRASHEIRAIEPDSSKLKIIALTARIIKGEEIKAKEAGMDDFLSKPLRLNTLKKILDKYLPGEKKTESKLKENETKTDINQRMQIKTFLTTMELSDSDIDDIINEYKNNLKNQIPELLRAIKAEDYDVIEKISHSLKGTSSNVGNKPMVDILTLLNDSVRSETIDMEFIKTAFEKIRKLFDQF